ncbi:MAG: hypothetical protein Q9184_002491 [Pyrenodesmia sp. 2 TL-2023]
MPDMTQPSAPQTITTQALHERIWDLEEELEDAKATNQSQAAQIEVHVAQVRRLRAELRDKERESHDFKIQPTAAKPFLRTEQGDSKKTEQKDVNETEQKDVKKTERNAKTKELDNRLPLSHEADDIREHIIEVSDSSTRTVRDLTRFGRVGPGEFNLHGSDNTLAQQYSTQPFHDNDPIRPCHRAAGIGPRGTEAGFSQDSDFSTSKSSPSYSEDDRGFHAPAAGRSGPDASPAGADLYATSPDRHKSEVIAQESQEPAETPHEQGATQPSKAAGRKRKFHRRRQDPLGILLGTLKCRGSMAGAANAVYGSRDRFGRVNRRISKEDPYGRVVIGDRMNHMSSCSHGDISYFDRFRYMTKDEVDAQILRLLGDASTTSPSTSNPSASTAGTGPQTGVKFENEDDDEMQEVDATKGNRKRAMVKIED